MEISAQGVVMKRTLGDVAVLVLVYVAIFGTLYLAVPK